MLRHLTKPFNTGVLRWGTRVESLSDGLKNGGLPLFFQQPDQPRLLSHEHVNLGSFSVQEGHDCLLLLGRWK